MKRPGNLGLGTWRRQISMTGVVTLAGNRSTTVGVEGEA
jgi:hypothetical protein